MANPNIFQQYLKPVRSMQDYSNDMDQAEQNKLALATARMQGQQAQQGVADDQAMRRATMESGGDQNKLVQALLQGGQYKGAQSVQKFILDADKSRADTGKTQAELLDKNLSIFRSYAPQVDSPEAAGRYAAAMYDHPVLGKFANQFGSREDVIKRNMEAFAKDPRAWMVGSAGISAEKLIETLKGTRQNTNLGNVSQGTTTNYYGEVIPGQTTISPIGQSADNIASNVTSRLNNQSTVDATKRGQNMADTRARDAQNNVNKLNGKAPPGYVWGPTGEDGMPTMIAVKNGPADLKMAGALNQDTQALTGSTASMDRLATAANEALMHPGLKSVYGLRGAIPNIPGSEAADAAALLNTLKSQVGFGVLQDMRNNSKTGGALGSVSDKENAMLQANLAALEKAQSFEQAQKSLKKIIEYADSAKGRLRDAYNLKHGQGSANPVRNNAAPGGRPSLNDIFN